MNFFMYIKRSKTLSAKYYQENKRKTTKKARERYQNLPKEEKEKMPQYGRECCKNIRTVFF